MSALKPCPFCGGEARIVSGCPGSHYVRCSQCHAATDDGGYERACDLWNRRAEPSAPSQDPTPVDDDIPRVFEQVEHHKWPRDAPSPAGVEVVAYLEQHEGEDDHIHARGSHVYGHIQRYPDLHKSPALTPLYGPEAIATLTASLDQATRRAEERWQPVIEQAAHVETGLACRADVREATEELVRLIREALSSTASSITEKKETPE